MGSMTRRGLLALVLLGAAALALAGCGDGKPKSITVVIAEYSKDHTKPFWQALAEQYTKQRASRSTCRSSTGTPSTSRSAR